MSDFLYVYIYANDAGHHHVSPKPMSKEEQTLNLYHYKGQVNKKEYLTFMEKTLQLVESSQSLLGNKTRR